MLRPVRQEWRRVATSEKINEKRSDEGVICGGCNPAFVGSRSKDSGKKGSAKAQLHQLCNREHWKHVPVFECCNYEGPDHHKLFTFKVLLNIEEASTILECYGNPRTNKKAAAEDAAEGALWCLKQMGYQLEKQ